MQSSTAAGCLDENSILAFVSGQAPPSTSARIEGHLVTCRACTALVAMAARQTTETLSDAPVPAPPPATHAPGSTIGRYTILEMVGRGGMGEVYAAYDPELDRRVAVKLLHDEPRAGGAGSAGQTRLLREAKAIARLSHPNVIVVHDAGTVDGRVFVAMEFVRGRTLSEWLGAAPRAWAEIQTVFLAAGRGLAAAHAAGLVHRDVKPQNIMVGDDGAVRVTDFGLASDVATDAGPGPAPAATDVATGGGRPWAEPLTRTGAWLGTPLYMAPEQFRARKADARSDQFAFCVSLYEALYGERPFASDSLKALRDAVLSGQVREPSNRSRAPSWVRRIVLRGLSADPAARFSSMDELLTALASDPMRRRRRVVMTVGAALAVVGATAGVVRLTARPAATTLCLGGPAKLAPIWELPTDGGPHPRRQAAEQAFLATGKPFAASSFGATTRALDGYAQRWTAMFKESCEATHVSGEQSEQVLDLRTDCLDSALAGLRAVTDVFLHADRSVVDSATNMTGGLPDLNRCADTRLLRAVVRPPSSPAERAKVDDLTRRVATVRALIDAGKPEAIMNEARILVDEAGALGYQPLIADATSGLGLAHGLLSNYDEALPLLRQALPAAVIAHDDPRAAEIAALVSNIMTVSARRVDEADGWAALADAYISRSGPSADRASMWLAQSRGTIRAAQERYAEAVGFFQQAIVLKEKRLGPDAVDVGISYESLGNALSGVGDFSGAVAATTRAFAILDRLGVDGTALAVGLINRGEALIELGRNEEALADFQRFIVTQKTLAPDHPWFGYVLTGIGQVHLRQGKPREAIPVLERALEIRAKVGDRLVLGDTRFALAQALGEVGGDRRRARALATSARDDYQSQTVPSAKAKRATVAHWLEAHPATAKRAR